MTNDIIYVIIHSMSKREKRLKAFYEHPDNVLYPKMVKVLEYYDIVLINSNGSHRLFIYRPFAGNPGEYPIQIVEPHGNSKYVHVRDVQKCLHYLERIIAIKEDSHE